MEPEPHGENGPFLFTDLLVYHERLFVLIYIKELCSGVSFILNERHRCELNNVNRLSSVRSCQVIRNDLKTNLNKCRPLNNKWYIFYFY